MILTRKEFHRRWDFRTFITIRKEELVDFPIEPLFKEIQADVPFRNHEYLFDNSNLSRVLCDDEVGVNKYCNAHVRTEQQRMNVIDAQIKNGTYLPVPIFQDIEHPGIIFVDDGFHRIFSAWKQGKTTIKCRVKQGKFKLERVMPFEDLPKLLGMLEGLFPKKLHDIKKLKKFLEKASKKNPKKMEITSISY